MKVTQVQARCLSIPIKMPFTETPQKEGIVIVYVQTDTGLEGVGITRNWQRFGVRELINREIGPYLIGKDPLNTEKIWRDAYLGISLPYQNRGGTIGRAVGAVDIALWDIKGKHTGLPVYRLLGGASSESVAAYTTCGFNFYSLDEVVEVSRKLAHEGHDPLKYQVVAEESGQDIAPDVERLKKIREAIGDKVRILVDCNGTYSFNQARELLQAIEPYNIAGVDHPVRNRDPRVMAELRKHTKIPIAGRAMGENQWAHRDFILAGAVDVMHQNVIDGGGYTECLKVAHMAELFHLPLGTGGAYHLHNMHLIAGVANGLWTEFHTIREKVFEVLSVKPPVVKNGRIPLPDKPGLGLEVNESAVTEYTDP